MRKIFRQLGILLAALVILFPAAGARGEGRQRKLTLMVYMCGSNLESGYGSASRDIEEMIAAGVGRDVCVLVMTGGTEAWRLGMKPEEISILEIGARGQRTVWTDAKMNMGDAATLTKLLQWGMENRPAEEYALILWNHGGGPVEGVCWDELFSMDHLSLHELTEGIAAAGMEKKLKWIGFDACLMCSLEVASAVSPYAEYMIASQETEPDFGWNYAFLAGITDDATGADTGRRIVDGYFEGHGDYKDTMTLACLDLSKTEKAEQALDAFFTSPSLAMTPETFSVLSKARGGTAGFGKAAEGTGEDGYDLVDARGLAESFGAGNEAEDELARALEETVVCSRSNEEGARGVSLYFPYANKRKYTEKWHAEYETLNFSAGYTRYIGEFGAVLTGEEQTDWSGLETEDAGFGANLENLFSLQLLPEQQEGFASAQLLILSDLRTHGILADNCGLVYTGTAELGENGLLTAQYTGRTLYIEQENGELYGPVAFGVTEDGRFAYIRMIYMPEGTSDPSAFTHVLYYVDTAPGAEYPEIVRTRVWDRVTETFTNRIAFNESDYAYIHMVEMGKRLPEADGRGLLPMYSAWEDGEILIGGLDISLPDRWRFRWVDEQRSGVQLYAVFQVTDTQQNVFCSEPVPVRNPYNEIHTAVQEETGNGAPRCGLTAEVIDSPEGRYVRFVLTADPPPEGAEYSFSRLTLNGNRVSKGYLTEITKQGDAQRSFQLGMNCDELYGLEQIETAEAELTVKTAGGREKIPAAFRFENCGVSHLWRGLVPLAEGEQDGIRVRVFSLSAYLDCDAEMRVLIENNTESRILPNGVVVSGGLELMGTRPDALEAGRSTVGTYVLGNDVPVSGYELETIEENPYFYTNRISHHLLQHRGITAISEMTLYFKRPGERNFEKVIRLELPEPWELREGDPSTYLNTSFWVEDPQENPSDPAERTELAENNRYAVACSKILLGKNGAALELEITNKAETPLTLYAKDPKVNGVPAVLDEYTESSNWDIAPGAVRVVPLLLKTGEIEPAPAELSSVEISFESAEQREAEHGSVRCVLTLTDPPAMGELKPVWIRPEGIRCEKATGEDEEIVLPGATETDQLLEEEITLPENAGSYVRYLRPELTEEQAARAEKGVMIVVRKIPDGSGVELISTHAMERGEDGALQARYSGLVLCPETEPDFLILSAQDWPEPDCLENTLYMNLTGYDYSASMAEGQRAENLTFRAHLAEGRTEITELELLGEQRPMDMAIIRPIGKFYPAEGAPADQYVMDWKTGMPPVESVPLKGKPLRLALRPAVPEDELYVIFGIKDADGTLYSPPMVPLFVE